MATAGRILIIPRGGYSSATQYEQLDLVLHNGDSWLAKQNVKGVEPSDNNSAYWHRFTDVNSAFGGKIGTDDISKIGDGTITGAIKFLDLDKVSKDDVVDNLESTATDLPLSAKQGKMLHDDNLVAYPIHEMQPIDEKQTFQYTGAKITIPARSYYNLTFMINYTNKKPKFIAICKSYNAYDELVSSNEGYYTSSCNYSGYTEHEITLYVWASFEGNGNSKTNAHIDGFYLKKQKDI
jgi:hypothetical protein